MTADEAQAYGIPVKNPGDTYYNATVEYKIPTYPHIGNAYVTVTKPNSSEDPTYFMIPTEAVDNENKLISSTKVQAFRVTEAEAMNYVGTVTSTVRYYRSIWFLNSTRIRVLNIRRKKIICLC